MEPIILLVDGYRGQYCGQVLAEMMRGNTDAPNALINDVLLGPDSQDYSEAWHELEQYSVWINGAEYHIVSHDGDIFAVTPDADLSEW